VHSNAMRPNNNVDFVYCGFPGVTNTYGCRLIGLQCGLGVLGREHLIGRLNCIVKSLSLSVSDDAYVELSE